MRTAPMTGLACLVALAGCVSGRFGATPAPGQDDPFDAEGDADRATDGRDTQRGAAAARELNLEVCDNDVDDDLDGDIDEECTCAADESRACYPGPAETLGQGVCHGGMQTCDMSFEFGTWGACAGAVLPGAEVLGNGLDDDCDGAADCLDADFAEDPACAPPPDPCAGAVEQLGNGTDDDCDGLADCADPDFAADARCAADPCAEGGVGGPECGPPPLCPDGQTPTYRKRDVSDPNLWGGSSITAGDGEPETTMTCEPGGGCAAGQVQAAASNGVLVCTDPPPDCGEGLFPSFTDAGTWECRPPCELVIHYGAIFGNLTVCAGEPDLQCDFGTVPTYVFESQQWECQPTCDNGMYDQIWFDGALLCVPC